MNKIISIIRKYLFLLLVAIIFLVIFSFYKTSCTPSVHYINKGSLQQLEDKGDDKGIIKNYAKSGINSISAYEIELLCKSLLNVQLDYNHFLKKHRYLNHVILYANAYNYFLKGKVNSAIDAYTDMTKSNDIRICNYGWNGLFSIYCSLENTNLLKKALDSYQESMGNNINEPLLLTYKIISLYQSANYASAEALLRLTDNNDSFFTDNAFIKAKILIANNNFSAANSIIDKLEEATGTTQTIINLRGQIIAYQDGEYKWQFYLNSYLDKYSYMKQVETNLCFYEISHGGDKKIKQSIDNIIKIANDNSNKGTSFLNLCNALIDLGYVYEAGLLYNEFSSYNEEPTLFLMSNIFLAKANISTREREKALKYYNFAKYQSPDNYDFLWLSYYLKNESGDMKGSADILEKILKWDPFEINVLSLLMEVNTSLKNWDAVCKYYNAIISSKRIINKEKFSYAKKMNRNARKHIACEG